MSNVNSDITFKRVTVSDKAIINSINAELPTYADWAFGTLLTWWDFYDDLEYALHNDNLLIRSSYLALGARPHITLLGMNNVDKTIRDIAHFQIERGEPAYIASSPHYVIESIADPTQLAIEEDLDNAEYVLSTKDHSELQKKELKKIRHKVQAFQNAYSHLDIHTEIQPIITDDHKVRLINSLHTWDNSFKNDRDKMESAVINKSLIHSDVLNLRSMTIYVGGVIAGFALFKYIDDVTINVNHMKVNYAYKDIFHYSMYRLAIHMASEGVKYLNIEQDLGIEGIRTYKQRLHPTEMKRKYSIIIK